jgi:hypothetical protein
MLFMAFSPEPVSQMNPIGREYSRFSGRFTRQGVRPDDRIRFGNRDLSCLGCHASDQFVVGVLSDNGISQQT